MTVDDDATALPVEEIDGHLLSIAGTADELVPAGYICERIRYQLPKTDGEVTYQYLSDHGASHRISAPEG